MQTATMAEVTDVEMTDPTTAKPPVVQQTRAVAASATPADLLRIAVESGADLDKLERLMALQTQWEAKEAKRAFDAAFSAFKAEAVTIIKGRKVTDGPLKNKSYAELHDVVNAVTPALSKHGLSSSWKLTKDEKDWMEVTCYLRHINGHEESVSMGGPPDAGGAKNAIQARASTKTYLERYTLKAITGLSEQADDDDGNGKGSKGNADETWMKWETQLTSAETVDDVRRIRAMAGAAFEAIGDVKSWNQFKTMADKKKAELEGSAK
jgi:hypothetical protein